MRPIQIYSASFVAVVVLLGVIGYAQGTYGTGVAEFDAIKIGQAGVGGVTWFNGTIVNDTTTDGADNPVTFGDGVRIDGRLWRGATQGPGDSLPLLLDDDAKVEGTLTVKGSLKVTTDIIQGGTSLIDTLNDHTDSLDLTGDLAIATADAVIDLQGFVDCVGIGLGSSDPVTGYDWSFCSNLWDVALASTGDASAATTNPLLLRIQARAGEIAQKRALMHAR